MVELVFVYIPILRDQLAPLSDLSYTRFICGLKVHCFIYSIYFWRLS